MSKRKTATAKPETPLERLPDWLVPLGGVLLLFQAVMGLSAVLSDGSSKKDHAPASGGKPEQVDVTFLITGDRRSADVSYTVSDRETKMDAAPLPMRKTVRMPEDGYMSVTVQNRYQNGPGTVTCTVLVGERIISQSSKFGMSKVASCSGVTPTAPTVRGARVPAQGNGLLPGETRLTRNVPIRRYSGPGSPTAGRVDDGDPHLSYLALGGDWGRSRAVDPQFEGHSRKQSFDTEANWEAVVASGFVDGDLATAARGPNRLRTLAGAVQDDRQWSNFPDTARGRDVASQPLTIDGHKAWAVVREIRFTKPGVRAKLDLSAVVVVDTGRPRPSYLWIDIPDTHKRLWPDVNTVIDSLRLDD
ncbi:hypothetical protein [Actinomadura gamaensis]|uniref:Uncharacterized protein n=1 Tax=Actinomadura gamaensis TaxID=1763541 RepID=A0ABV9TRQ3_9ACTN